MLLQENINITYVLLLGSAGMLLLCVGIFAFFLLYQKKLFAHKLQVSAMETLHKDELLQGIVEQVELERKRIARDLHDEVGMLFTLLSRKVEQLHSSSTDQNNEPLFKETKLLTSKGLLSTRRIAYDMIPPELETLGLIATLENFFSQLENSTTIIIDFKAGTFTYEPDHKTSLAIFRITQELCSNTLRYAKADAISVALYLENGIINYQFSDNGNGFNATDKINGKGLGLRSIENRVNMIKGKAEIKTSPGKGFSISIQIPYYIKS